MTTSTRVGGLRGEFAVGNDGAAVYTIPLALPPGTAGVEPSLALSYNSGGGNDLLGVGWQLGRLSMITRVGRTKAQDSAHGTVSYDANDRFTLDGYRLVPVQGSYGQPGAVYHTEIETWQQVTPTYGTTAGRSGPDSFQVVDKRGAVYQYGTTPDSQIAASSTNPSIRVWALCRVTDRNGNYMTVTYDNSGGSYAPARIDYTGHGTEAPQRSVQFTYETRPDPFTHYLGGAAITITQRLVGIDAYVGSAKALSYQLAYQPGTATARSRLVSVTMSGADGVPVTPTTFQWQEGTTTPLAQAPVTTSTRSAYGGNFVPFDIDGSGHMSFLNASRNSAGNLALQLYLNNGSGGLTGPVSVPTPSLPYGGQWLAMDVDGDGSTDLVYARPTEAGDGTTAAQNAALAFTVFMAEADSQGHWNLVAGTPDGATPGGQTMPGWGTIYSADVDGDGLIDLVYTDTIPGQGQEFALMHSNGSGFAVPGTSLKTSLPGNGVCLPLDFDGDGQTDIVYAYWTTAPGSTSQQVLALAVLLSKGTSLTVHSANILPAGVSLAYPGNVIPLDLNGDGLTDLVYARAAADGKSLSLTPLLNTGQGYVVQPTQTLPDIPYQATLSPAEVNGDDRTDLVAAVNNTANNQSQTQVHVLLSHGTGFTEAPAPPALAAGAYASSMLTLDLLGRGMTNLVFPISTNNMLQLQSITSAGSYPDLLTTVAEGLGGRYTVTYKPTSDGTVYTHTAATVKPQGMLAGGRQGSAYGTGSLQGGSAAAVVPGRILTVPGWLVSAHAKLDGQGGDWTYTYQYSNAAVDLAGGRGWQGFASQTCTDSDTGTVAVTTYQQAFPLTWQVATHAISRASDGALMHQTTLTQTAVQPYPNVPVYDVNVTQNVTATYTFGHLDATRTVQTQFDAFGNATMVSDLGDGSGLPLYRQNTYDNDTAQWIIGQQLTTIQTADSAGQQVLSSERVAYDPQTGNVVQRGLWHDQTGAWLDMTYTYDAYGNRLSETDPAGAVRTFTYDPTYHTFLASLAEPATAAGHVLTTTYQCEPAFGRVTRTTDANGVVWQRQYDPLGQLQTQLNTNPQGALVAVLERTTGQDSTGIYQQTQAAVDWGGQHWASQRDYLDGFGRVHRTVVTGADGATPITTVRQLNSRGQLLTESLPAYPTDAPLAVTYQYDAYGRLTRLTRPADGGATTTTTYQYPNTFTTAETAAAGTALARTTTTVHGTFRDRCLPVTVTDATGATVHVQYDPLGRTTGYTDPVGTQVTLAYDTLGETTLSRTQNGGVTVRSETTAYDPVGRTATTTDARGHTVSQTRDALGRLILKVDDAGHRTVFTYDTAPHHGLTRPASTTFPDGTAYAFDYDALGNEAVITATVDGSTYTFQRSFLPFGRAGQVTYPDGAVGTVTCTPGGFVGGVTIAQGGQTVASVALQGYTALGKPQTLQHGNGVTETLSYNGPGQLHAQVVAAPGGAALSNRVFAWNLLDDLSTITDHVTAADSYGFQYDAAGRLTTATGPYATPQSFAYDLGGNLTSKAGVAMTYRNGLLAAAGSTMVQSDAMANIQAIAGPAGTTALTYDAQGRLVAAGLTSFTYDYEGRRLSKTTPGGVRTYYVAPDYEVTVLPNGQTQHTKYLRSPAGLAAAITTVDQAGSGGAAAAPGVPQAGVCCFHRDQVNSSTLVTGGSGAVLSRVAYLPFGEVASLTGPDAFRAKFGGRELDAETGLYDLSARYYSAPLGRFVSPDDRLGGPVGGHDVFNPFAYVLNSPACRVDPTGHSWFSHAVHGVASAASSVGSFASGAYHTVTSGVSGAYHTVSTGVTSDVHQVTSGVTSAANWMKNNPAKWVPYAVDGFLIVAGVACMALTPIGGPFASVLGSTLLGAGISGLTYNLRHPHGGFSWQDWGIQLGIGAAVGLVTGGIMSGAGVLADSFAAGAAGRIALMAFAGAVSGGGGNAFSQFLENEAEHDPPAEGVGWAALVGGVFGGFGAGLGEAGASAASEAFADDADDAAAAAGQSNKDSTWSARGVASPAARIVIRTGFTAGGKAMLAFGPRWNWWENGMVSSAHWVD